MDIFITLEKRQELSTLLQNETAIDENDRIIYETLIHSSLNEKTLSKIETHLLLIRQTKMKQTALFVKQSEQIILQESKKITNEMEMDTNLQNDTEIKSLLQSL